MSGLSTDSVTCFSSSLKLLTLAAEVIPLQSMAASLISVQICPIEVVLRKESSGVVWITATKCCWLFPITWQFGLSNLK